MPDSKITALASTGTGTDPANDPLVIVDVSDTSMAATGTTKKVTLNQLLACSPSATLASATITGDLTAGSATVNGALLVQTATARPTIQATSNGTASTLRFIGKTNAGVTTDFEQGINLANQNSFELYDNANGQVATRYVNTGTHNWFITGSTAMTLNSTGLGIGGGPASTYKFQSTQTSTSYGGWYLAGLFTSPTATMVRLSCSTPNLVSSIANDGDGGFKILTNGTLTTVGSESLVVTPTGNVGIGVTPINRLTVAGNMAVGGTGNNGLQFHSGSPVSGNLVWWLTNDQTNSNILNLYYYSAGVFSGRALVVNQSGNFMVRTPATPPTIPDNEMMVFNLTSNTNLRVSVKGTDGVTRTANLTLAP